MFADLLEDSAGATPAKPHKSLKLKDLKNGKGPSSYAFAGEVVLSSGDDADEDDEDDENKDNDKDD